MCLRFRTPKSHAVPRQDRQHLVAVQSHRPTRRTSAAAAAAAVVSVELARPVGGTVVVRVADRRHAAVSQTLHATIHRERARHSVDHPSSAAFFPVKF